MPRCSHVFWLQQDFRGFQAGTCADSHPSQVFSEEVGATATDALDAAEQPLPLQSSLTPLQEQCSRLQEQVLPGCRHASPAGPDPTPC